MLSTALEILDHILYSQIQLNYQYSLLGAVGHDTDSSAGHVAGRHDASPG